MMPRSAACGVTVVADVRDEGEQAHRLKLQLIRTRELEEAGDHLVEPADLVGDDADVLGDVRRRHRGGPRGRRRAGPLPTGAVIPPARTSFCFSSSRWIVIAFSGFFTSCATPAISRPRAASLLE
jgi:hypothetical protein